LPVWAGYAVKPNFGWMQGDGVMSLVNRLEVYSNAEVMNSLFAPEQFVLGMTSQKPRPSTTQEGDKIIDFKKVDYKEFYYQFCANISVDSAAYPLLACQLDILEADLKHRFKYAYHMANHGNDQDAYLEKKKKIYSFLDRIIAKEQQFISNYDYKAENAVRLLHQQLSDAAETFFAHPLASGAENAFISKCKKAISDSRGTLEQHRNFWSMVVSFFANLGRSKPYFFKTASAQLLDEMEKALEQKPKQL